MPPLATWETQRGARVWFPGLEEAAAVAHPVDAYEMESTEEREHVREERCDE